MLANQLQRISDYGGLGIANLCLIWYTTGLLLGIMRVKQLCDSGVFFIMMGQPPIGMPLFFQRLAQMVSISIYIGHYLVLWPLDIGNDSGNNFRH